MGGFGLSLSLFVSLALAGALNVKSTGRSNLRKVQPKAGLAVTLTSSKDAYEEECTKGSLMPMLDLGAKGTIVDVDETGEGSVMMKASNGDEAWVPLRSLVGFENWIKGAPNPGPNTSGPNPGAPAPATFNMFAPAPAVDKRPSDFMSGGCQFSGDAERVKHGYTRQAGMTKSFCFLHCRKTSGNRYFGLTKGGICFCSELPIGAKTSKKMCDTVCSGNTAEKCGGIGVANVYTMMNCNKAAPEHLAMERAVKLASLYGSIEGESCAQTKNNACELNGSTKMLGTPDECKLACWDGKGADRCNGFSYNSVLGRCKFFKDVIDGGSDDGMPGTKVFKKETLTCYFKQLGYPY